MDDRASEVAVEYGSDVDEVEDEADDQKTGYWVFGVHCSTCICLPGLTGPSPSSSGNFRNLPSSH